MQAQQQRELLKVAREVIEDTVLGQPLRAHRSSDPLFAEKRGCFVTVKNHGRLRGCIGTFQAEKPLLKTIEQMAGSALDDPRFPLDRVTPDELGQIDIEISVLSPLVKTDDPLSLELGKHGIYIRRGLRRGCFLPQVATELGWSKEQFLSQCCAGKTGLEPDAWKKLDTEVLLFTAEVFGEAEEPAPE